MNKREHGRSTPDVARLRRARARRPVVFTLDPDSVVVMRTLTMMLGALTVFREDMVKLIAELRCSKRTQRQKDKRK